MELARAGREKIGPGGAERESLTNGPDFGYFCIGRNEGTMTTLSNIQQKFILHWGEMGLRWGINRTVAQIHALLYLSPKPLTAEEICEALGVARSNVSNSLRELQNWGIVKVVHVMGDRRDHFESMKDVWEMFRIVLAERKKREVDPTIEMLRAAVDELEKSGSKDAYSRERLGEMKDFFETMSGWYNQVNQLPTPAVVKFVKMGEKLRKMFS
jgi:DNA-binding transcriptional regulator GbsR (MarR family)